MQMKLPQLPHDMYMSDRPHSMDIVCMPLLYRTGNTKEDRSRRAFSMRYIYHQSYTACFEELSMGSLDFVMLCAADRSQQGDRSRRGQVGLLCPGLPPSWNSQQL